MDNIKHNLPESSKITDQDMIKIPPRPPVTSDLAKQVVQSSREKRLWAEERGMEFKHAYIGREIYDSFHILCRETMDMYGAYPCSLKEINHRAKGGPTLTYEGVDYYLVNVKNHLYYVIEYR